MEPGLTRHNGFAHKISSMAHQSVTGVGDILLVRFWIISSDYFLIKSLLRSIKNVIKLKSVSWLSERSKKHSYFGNYWSKKRAQRVWVWKWPSHGGRTTFSHSIPQQTSATRSNLSESSCPCCYWGHVLEISTTSSGPAVRHKIDNFHQHDNGFSCTVPFTFPLLQFNDAE